MTNTKATHVVGNGVSTTYRVTHLLGTENISVGAYDKTGQYVLINTTPVTKDAVDVEFMVAPKEGEYTIEVLPA